MFKTPGTKISEHCSADCGVAANKYFAANTKLKTKTFPPNVEIGVYLQYINILFPGWQTLLPGISFALLISKLHKSLNKEFKGTA